MVVRMSALGTMNSDLKLTQVTAYKILIKVSQLEKTSVS